MNIVGGVVDMDGLALNYKIQVHKLDLVVLVGGEGAFITIKFQTKLPGKQVVSKLLHESRLIKILALE